MRQATKERMLNNKIGPTIIDMVATLNLTNDVHTLVRIRGVYNGELLLTFEKLCVSKVCDEDIVFDDNFEDVELDLIADLLYEDILENLKKE